MLFHKFCVFNIFSIGTGKRTKMMSCTSFPPIPMLNCKRQSEKFTDFEDLPADWECPLCGALKGDFEAELRENDEEEEY